MLVDKKVSEEKKQQQQKRTKNKTNKQKHFWRLKLLLRLPNEFGVLCLA